MLVLSRKPMESIVIGDDITITVMPSTGDSVRIGIDAPRHINIARSELLQPAGPPEFAMLHSGLEGRPDEG